MRPPGGFTTDMFNWASDIDIYRIWAELLTTGHVSKRDHLRKYYCCYASRRSHLSYGLSHDALLEKYGSHIVQIERVPHAFQSALGETAYIFRSPDLEDIREIQQDIHALKDQKVF
jgi:hypothetical protein